MIGECEVDLPGCGQEKVSGSYEEGNEPLDSLKC
jgi:hypothetical protein